MEPMEVIDLSSDDEKSPLKIKEDAVKIEKTKPHSIVIKQEAPKKNINNNDDEDVEILENVVSNKKRTIKSSSMDNCPTKKMKLFDDGGTPRTGVAEPESHRRSLFNLSKTNAKKSSSKSSGKLRSENSATRSLGRPSEAKKTIISDGKSSLNTKTSTNGVKSLNNDSQPKAGPSSRFVDIHENSSSTGPQLVVKSKVKVSESAEAASAPIKEMFQSLMEACLKKEASKEMERIVNRFKKRFDNLEPGFAKSEFFMHLVRNKRDLISNKSTNTPYLLLAEVMDEMKARQIRKVQIIEYENENKSANNVGEGKDSIESKPGDKSSENCTINEGAGTSKDLKENKYLRALEKSMKRCQRLIQKCETAEVNFDDENDSYYILAERYKYRMVELYNKYCEITGERPDAARPYLRPKNLNPTPLPLLNNAITSFVNHKISKMNKLGRKKKNINFAEALIFPDYIDILKCVEKCNSEQNLKLSKAKQKEIAKKAFTDLGAHLQRSRQLDYYDTFSLYLEREDQDPVLTDESLAEKLRKNGEIGKKKLNEVFEEFVAKQNEMAENSAIKHQDNLSNESSHNTENDSAESENESVSTKKDDDFDEVENVDPSTRLQPDSEQDVVQVDGHAEKKNNPIEKQEQSSIQSLDEKISLPHSKAEEKKGDMDTGEPGDEETSKTNEKILVKKDKEIVSQNNDVGYISVKKIFNQLIQEKIDVDSSNNEECVNSPNTSPIKKPESSFLIKKRIIGSIATKSTAPSALKKRVSLQPAFAVNEKTMDRPITETTGPSSNETSVPLPIPVAIVGPTPLPVIKEATALPSSEKLDTNLAYVDSLAIPAENTEVIATPLMAPAGETSGVQNEKKPLLRPRSFAKASAHWTDFQASTSSNVTNSESSVTLGGNAEIEKSVKISPEQKKIEQIKLRKLCALSPLKKTDFKVKKMTLMIPRSVIGGNNARVSLKSVTNNITVLNIGNQAQLQPKITSVVSHGVDTPGSVIKFGKGKDGANCDDKMINVTSDGHKSSEKINPARESRGNNKQCSVKVPANQESANDREATGLSPQRHYKILSPKKISSQIQTPKIRSLPVRDKHGKEIAYQIIKSIPAGSILKRVNTQKGVAQSQTSRGSGQQAGYSLARTNDSKFRFQIPQSINEKSSYIKVSNSRANNANEIRDASTDGVPLYVID